MPRGMIVTLWIGSEWSLQKRNQRVAGFVIRGHPLLFVRQQHRLALGAHEHLVLRKFEVVHGDLLAIDAGGIQRSLVDHVGQVGAAEPRCSASQHVEVDVVGTGTFLT